MGNPWDAEHELNESGARRLIESQFQELVGCNLRLLGKGYDNTVFDVDDTYVFRFPRRDIAVKLLETEAKVLPKFRNSVLLPYPEPKFFGKPEGDFPYPFLGYKKVFGELPRQLDVSQRIQSAEPLAHFLKSIHSFPIEEARKLGVPNDLMRRTDIPFRKPKLKDMADNLSRLGQNEIYGKVHAYLDTVTPFKGIHRETFNHGDLHIRNIMVNKAGVLSGIIDWGDMHIGHPAVDLSLVFAFLPIEGREAFYRIYGELDEETTRLARFKAVYTGVSLLLYGLDIGDVSVVEVARETINYSLLDVH
ncbi:phosphotransferase [Peribacillus alkalitolerans]|uniref:phosphotransferase n=1 Tax=Peribacillus alkalitolerans TaxID=1550385 RepID=UPI0013D3575B|nr:phosphotransferase [Peribacillus alkalitolerans]